MIPDMDMHETLPQKIEKSCSLVTLPEKLPKQIVSGCLWRFHANLEEVSNKREDGSTTVKYVSKKCDSQRGNMLATVSQGNVRVCDIYFTKCLSLCPKCWGYTRWQTTECYMLKTWRW